MAQPRFAITPDQFNTFQADDWAQTQTNKLADDWAAQALAKVQAPTPSDSLTNPLGTAGAAPSPLAPVAPEPPVQAPPEPVASPEPFQAAPASNSPQVQPGGSSPAPLPPTPVAPLVAPAVTAPPPPQGPDETISNPFGEAFRQVGAAVSGAAGAVSQATGIGQPPPVSTVPTPSDTLTDPLKQQGVTPNSAIPDWLRSLIVQNAPESLKNNEEFIATVAAGAKAESGWDPNSVQKGGGGRGLFQFDVNGGMGTGLSEAQLFDPQFQASKIIPQYAAAFQSAPSGLTGAEKASWVAGQAEKPYQYDQAESTARRNYAAAYGDIASGQPAAAAQTFGQPPGSPAVRTSQFGLGLSSEDAYAACGPAAAIAFANTYGRQPTADEALTLAKHVGWTSGSGMAGVSSEQKLLADMGVATKLETSVDWSHVEADASAGNPVILDSPGHYWYVSGTRAGRNGEAEFNVGTSGTDLKGGSAWMTAAQLNASSMGSIRAALYADNPTSATPSVAPAPPPATAPADQADQWAARAGIVSAVPVPDETTSNPFGEAFRQLGNAAGGVKDQVGQAVSQWGSPQGPGGQVGGAIGNVASAAGTVGRAAADAIGPLVTPDLAGATGRMEAMNKPADWSKPIAPQLGFDPLGSLEKGIPQVIEGVQTGNLGMEGVLGGALGMAGGLTSMLPGSGEAGAISDVARAARETAAGVKGAVTDPAVQAALRASQRGEGLVNPFDVRGNIAAADAAAAAAPGRGLTLSADAQEMVDSLGGRQPAIDRLDKFVADNPHGTADVALDEVAAMRRELSAPEPPASVGGSPPIEPPSSSATPATPTQGSTANNTLMNMYGKVQTEASNSIPGRVEDARRNFVRAWTDNRLDLAEFQKDAQKAVGRPLTADEMAYEMRRMNPAGAATLRVQDELKPAIQSVGKDADWLRVYLTHVDNIDVGKAMGNADRSFSGGLSAADSQAGLADMAQQLGPERMAKVEQAGQQVVDYGKSLLQRKVDSGLISQDLFNELTTKYPNYSPTRITDYLKDPAGIPSGKKLSVQSAGLKRNTVEGTVRAREDPLASMVRLGYETESLATKNETAQAFLKLRELNPDAKMMIQKVADDASNPRGYEKMKVFENGVPQTYQMPSYIAKAIKEEPVAPIPILTPLMNMFRMAATQRNPLFLAANAMNDAASYTLRSSSRLGGPQNVPKIAVELVKAYGDAFQGLLSGEFRGNTARFIKGGGAQSGFFSSTPEDARKVADALQLPHAFAIRSDHVVKDISRLVGQALTLKPIEAIGERIELAPRVAAMRLAEKSGSTAQQAVLAGRTVTIDFSTGGTWAKVLNQVIPFFNVATQAGAQLPRAFAENPRGFITTATGLLAAPTVAMEAWNRSDPQRAKDYADVPQYVKDAGLVFMLPTPDQTDARGNRKPQYAFFPLREYSPFAVLTREAAGRAMGANPREWADLLLGTGKSVSPVSGNSASDAASTFVPLGVSTAMQLSTNQDWFRGSKIVSQSADEQASAFSKAASEALNKMGMQTHPSAVEFTARDLGAGVAGMALAGSDMIAGKARQDSRVQSTPGVGGLVGRFLQDRTGEILNRAVDQPVSADVEKALNAAGISTPTLPYEIRVTNAMTGNLSPPMELHQDERAAYQKLMSDRLSERLKPMLADPSWEKRTIESRKRALDTQVKAAREYAEAQVYRAMKPEDRQARMAAGRESLKVKAKPAF